MVGVFFEGGEHVVFVVAFLLDYLDECASYDGGVGAVLGDGSDVVGFGDSESYG